MKKTIFILFSLSILATAAIALVSRLGKEERLVISPNARGIPPHAPLEFFVEFQQLADEKGYTPEWLDLDSLPKKHQYWQRLKNFVLNKSSAKAFIFHNYHPFFSKAKIDQLPRGKRILIMWEPPSVILEMYEEGILNLFDKVFTWNDELVDGKKFFKMCYNVLRPMQENLPKFEDRKFLCMVASNLKFNDFEKELYSTRREIVHFFEEKPPGTLDLYGRNWEGFRDAKGTIPDKLETLKEYKFNICFENTKEPGYITEKIFDCFVTATIPVYYGATNIEAYIPKGCYIDFRDFKGFEEMFSYIEHLTQEEYEAYVANMRAYLDSKQAQQFSRLTFAKKIMDAIEE